VHPVPFPDPFQRTSQPLTVVAVIPARYASTRLPAKPLVDIAGRPMIEHVYRRAARARGIDAVVVATDDEGIAAAVARFGGIVRMTASSHRTGTDRIAELAGGLGCTIVVNVQGDLPLVEPEMIAEVVAPLKADASLRMATLCTALRDPNEYARPSVVKVVTDRAGNALYFSRAPIPYVVAPPTAIEGPLEPGVLGGPAKAGCYEHSRDEEPPVASGFSRALVGVNRTFKHIGIYAYRRDFLLEFAALPRTPLEEAESLEQLRALEHGIDIRVIETEFESIEIDTPEDLENVRRLLGGQSAVDVDTGVPAAARPRSAIGAFR
jgi:3-deoxy-manno-octulosonate cytidylyltransferase (CMP-KDO synthetase)